MGGTDFPTPQEDAIRRSHVKRLAMNADLREGSVGLLEEVRSQGPADRMQERWRNQPTDDRGNERWGEEQEQEDAERASHVLGDTQIGQGWFRSGNFARGNQERKSTSSRWNIFTARKRAAAA